jgi:hypothetical protein
MKPIIVSFQNRGEATPPSGEPPRVYPKGSSENVTVLVSDSEGEDLERALTCGISYENEVTFTSQTTFVETGTMRVGGGEGNLYVSTIGEGHLGPSSDTALLAGAVIWRIDGGDGRFEGVTGLMTSNFLLAADQGQFREYLTAVVFPC